MLNNPKTYWESGGICDYREVVITIIQQEKIITFLILIFANILSLNIILIQNAQSKEEGHTTVNSIAISKIIDILVI